MVRTPERARRLPHFDWRLNNDPLGSLRPRYRLWALTAMGTGRHCCAVAESPLWVARGRLGDLDRVGCQPLPPLGPGHHHIDVATAAPGADKPLAPPGNGGLGAVPLGHLRRVGLGPVTACLAPDDKSDTGRSRVSDRHRRTWPGLLPPLRGRRIVSAWRRAPSRH